MFYYSVNERDCPLRSFVIYCMHQSEKNRKHNMEMKTVKYEKSCGAVVYKVENGTLYFLLEHMVQGHTSIPKGHVEGDETEAETALREIREETGLEVKLDTAFRHEVQYSPYEGIEKQVIFFAAELAGGEMKNQECEVSSLEWVPYDRAIEAVTYDTDKEVLTHAAEYLGAAG